MLCKQFMNWSDFAMVFFELCEFVYQAVVLTVCMSWSVTSCSGAFINPGVLACQLDLLLPVRVTHD